MNKVCIGCGIKLQSRFQKKLGYVPSEKKEDAEYCERCFKIIHYNKADVASLPEESKKIVDIVNKKAEFVFFLIDFLNINELTIAKFKEIKVPKTLIISKCDIIPKYIREVRIIENMQKTYQIENEIIFISSTKKKNLSLLPNMMEKMHVKEAYVLGYTNSGKSTLINCLYERFTKNTPKITTSLIPNTTLDFIKIKINDNFTLIDSPGFVPESMLYNTKEVDLIKRMNTKKFLRPITYQSKKGMCINIEDKILFLLEDDHNSLTFYVSNQLNIKKQFRLPKTDLKKKKLKIKENSDIIIRGVGFINIKKACTLTIYTMNEDVIEIRESWF